MILAMWIFAARMYGENPTWSNIRRNIKKHIFYVLCNGVDSFMVIMIGTSLPAMRSSLVKS